MSKLLQQRVDASSYLSGIREKYGLSVSALGHAPFKELTIICDRLANVSADTPYQDVQHQLIECKARFAFSWSLAELSSIGSASERGQWQTRFAELTIDLALRAAWQEVSIKHKAVQHALNSHPNGVPGLFIFGMGKLGGGDLNFSSDVDLVAYFDPTVLPVPVALGKSYICHLVLQKLTQLLGQDGRSDFIWRVDWRLRPNASATTLAMSTEAAQEYYFFRASAWHRLALMKARVVAGDRAAGSVFLNSITPFIWRQNLDYRALDELAEIKNRINLEHPALRVQRLWREPINDDVAGFNIKLGSGGIREIEFIANALQLVWGGKHYSLRTPNTVEAIGELEKLGHLKPELANTLVAAYQNLRRIENAIQIMGNQQTHLIPSQLNAQQSLLILLNQSEWLQFVSELNRHRRLVSDYFESLFAEQSNSQYAQPSWPVSLSSAAMEIVEAWENGFNQYGVSINIRHRLKPLTKALADYLSTAEVNDGRSFDASQTVMRVHDFFRTLPQGEQYFRLLAESPRLLDSIIPPLLFSPAMSNLLRQSPHIIDCYMGQGLDLHQGFDSLFVLQAENYEVRLERMRRFVNEQLYQLYLMFLQGEMKVTDFQRALSDLAEHTLELALKVVAQNMQLDEVPIAVLGMGKIALRRMSPLSDLDLIFIFDPDKHSLELVSKFVSRLQTAISTPMREGIVYELDTRLRPSGRSGAPTVSIDSFAAHQLQRAHTWEHIALVPGRLVAGDRSLQTRIDQVKRQVLTNPRCSGQFKKDAAKMWNRISKHRLKGFDSSVMFSKLRPGGLMQSEYLAACIVLQEASKRTGELSSLDFDGLLESCLSGTHSLSNLAEIIQFWRIQQLWERLLGLTELPLDNLPEVYLERLLAQSEVNSLAELLDKKHDYSQTIINTMQSMFDEIYSTDFKLDDWRETHVTWC